MRARPTSAMKGKGLVNCVYKSYQLHCTAWFNHAAVLWHMTHYNVSVAITVWKNNDKDTRHLSYYCRSYKTCLLYFQGSVHTLQQKFVISMCCDNYYIVPYLMCFTHILHNTEISQHFKTVLQTTSWHIIINQRYGVATHALNSG